jgi:hypothetical protein
MVEDNGPREHPVMQSETERRTTMTRTYDVTSTFVQTIDADPDIAEHVLATTDPMRSLVDRLMALGLDDRAIWSTGEPTHSLIWRFGPDAGHARIDWTLTGRPTAPAARCSRSKSEAGEATRTPGCACSAPGSSSRSCPVATPGG